MIPPFVFITLMIPPYILSLKFWHCALLGLRMILHHARHKMLDKCIKCPIVITDEEVEKVENWLVEEGGL